MNTKLVVAVNAQSRFLQERIKWAEDVLARADAGEVFNVPVGHDEFIFRVHMEMLDHKDALISHYELAVLA